MIGFYLLVVLGVFLSSCSQILLKKSANKRHTSIISEVFNMQVVIAYSVFFVSVIFNLIALKNGVGIKDLPIIESLGFVFVPLLSYFFLEEITDKKNLFAMLLILSGIIIFYL